MEKLFFFKFCFYMQCHAIDVCLVVCVAISGTLLSTFLHEPLTNFYSYKCSFMCNRRSCFSEFVKLYSILSASPKFL